MDEGSHVEAVDEGTEGCGDDVGVFGGADCADEEAEVVGCYVRTVVQEGNAGVVEGSRDEGACPEGWL